MSSGEDPVQQEFSSTREISRQLRWLSSLPLYVQIRFWSVEVVVVVGGGGRESEKGSTWVVVSQHPIRLQMYPVMLSIIISP